MGKLFLAGIGGFIGSSLRYAATGYVQQLSRSIHFPYGTLAVNLIGCFLIGFLSQLAESRGMFTAESRTFVFIGILGGFTTFSAFGYEGVFLIRRGEVGIACAYAGLSVLCGFAAVWLALKLFSFGAHH